MASLLSFFSTAAVMAAIIPSRSALTVLPVTDVFTSVSGLPVCRYALGGAARSNQPQSLVSAYLEEVGEDKAPFCFYYNPNRYPAFMRGVEDACSSPRRRRDLFVVGGGTSRSAEGMERRLRECLARCGGGWLDMFVLEYVCPGEEDDDDGDLDEALRTARDWVDRGLVRRVAASTHSHAVGATLATRDGLDALFLRYNMAHREAAESLSFAAAARNGVPVVAFTSTRWNALQNGHADWDEGRPPTTGDCLSFAASTSSVVEVVLHSARDEDELREAVHGFRTDMPTEEVRTWTRYGQLDWNQDGFDEYPKERSTIP